VGVVWSVAVGFGGEEGGAFVDEAGEVGGHCEVEAQRGFGGRKAIESV
jgi:hypothetical protein